MSKDNRHHSKPSLLNIIGRIKWRRRQLTPANEVNTNKDRMKFKELRAQMNDLDRRDCDNFLAVCELLRLEAVSNLELLSSSSLYRSESYQGLAPSSTVPESTDSDDKRFSVLFDRIQTYLVQAVEPLGVRLYSVAGRYDFAEVRANGYRSLLQTVRACCTRILTDARYIRTSRHSIAFRAGNMYQELNAFVHCLGELRWCLHYAVVLSEMTGDGELYLPDKWLTRPEVQRLIYESELIEQVWFYGRCLGFQYTESMQRPLQYVLSGMAAYAEEFSSCGKASGSIRKLFAVFHGAPKYYLYAEKRAEQIVNMTRHANIDFCKSFWNIGESTLFHNIPMLVCPPVDVSEAFQLPAVAFHVPSVDPDTEEVLIQPPLAHSGPGPVEVRLISYRRRMGQGWIFEGSLRQRTLTPASPYLLVHCHGGGFIAQSSRSHEIYLRYWAKQLDCPILSIDYSLAPEHPFPRAMEECFFAYCWALKNCERLGSTGQRILLCGDSAGGNLILTLCLRAMEFGVRLPDGVFAAYTPVLVRPVPSPSRILAIMDPLLPAGVLLRCLLAYAGIDEGSLPECPPPGPFRSGLSSTNSPEEETLLFSADNLNSPLDSPTSPCSLSSIDDAFEAPEGQAGAARPSDLNGLKRSATWSFFNQGSSDASWTHELAKRHFVNASVQTPSPLYRMQLAEIPPDPFMSPYLADDDLLRRLPPTAILACHLDPVLDDCVEFAKRLSRLGCRVKLKVLEDLPHGFLNLSLVSKDAKLGSDECIALMRALLEDTLFQE